MSSLLSTLVVILFAGLLCGLALLFVPIAGAPLIGGALVVVPLILLAILFAAAETAVAAVRRPRVQQLLEERARGAQELHRLLENSAGLVATIRLVVITAAVAVNALLVALLAEPLSEALGGHGAAYAVIAVLVLLFSLVLVDQVGHAFGLRHAEAVALGTSGPVRLAVMLLSPLTKLLSACGALIYRRPAQASGESSGVTEAGIMLQVDVAEEEGVLEEDEGEMIRSIFEFGDTVAREIMVPRIDVHGADGTRTLGDLVDMAIEVGHSRLPIYEGTIDKVLGIFYVKDALRFLREGKRDVDIREIMRPAYFVPETKKVDDLLREMQLRRVHLAVVVDEYGGTAGLVTIEDILEEIVGEIQDEFDPEEVVLERLSETEAIVDAIMPLDDLNDELGIQLEDQDVDTLGGYVYSKLGRVPVQGDVVDDGAVRLVVEEVEGNRIERVRLVKLATPGATDEATGTAAAGTAAATQAGTTAAPTDTGATPTIEANGVTPASNGAAAASGETVAAGASGAAETPPHGTA